MPSTFFTADSHFGHTNIIRYCNRPFSSAEEMNEAIISRFCSVLRPGDILYHLGDVAWSSFPPRDFLRRLPTKEVHLILGNHDKYWKYDQEGFRWVGQYKGIRIDKTPVALFHYPIRSWNHKGSGGFALYGHCHGALEPGIDRSMDVGVDTHNFYPWAWEEVRDKLKDKPFFQDSEERFEGGA